MSRKFGLFRLANFGFAIPLERLLRVVDSVICAPLPLTPERMAGVLVLDDEIIPLLDSNWLPDVAVGKGLSAGYKILIATEYGPVALPAETTIGIIAESRCERVESDQKNIEFFPDCISYRNNCYQVLNIDVLMMSFIRP